MQFRSKDSSENKGSSESNGSLDIRTVQKTRNGFASVTRAVKKQVTRAYLIVSETDRSVIG